MKAILDGVDIEYKKQWQLHRLSWLVTGSFVWNIDEAMGRKRVNHNKDEIWVAPELVDNECIKSPIESKELFYSIDRALVKRLFALNRIARKLESLS